MLILNKFAFYHVPRTGGQSIEHLLQFDEKLRHPGWLRIGYGHDPLCIQPVDVEKFDIFTNIRNPFHRLVSHYELIKAGRSHEIKLDKSVKFKEFLYDYWGAHKDNNRAFHSTDEYLFIDGKLPENVTLIKMEEMNQRWPVIIKDYFGIEGRIRVPHKNSVPHADPMTYYDDDLINFVKEREKWAWSFYS